ncbi:unnamed protein product [Rotaria magnacalcarata]|uniref:Uncharacterized protein n=1 Tax=Rotaria magnacalcarata TaxID=392030 RepID=A0A816SXK3_9BILA|nr:unnamed protein product [Rotaria magnacalcarata]
MAASNFTNTSTKNHSSVNVATNNHSLISVAMNNLPLVNDVPNNHSSVNVATNNLPLVNFPTNNFPLNNVATNNDSSVHPATNDYTYDDLWLGIMTSPNTDDCEMSSTSSEDDTDTEIYKLEQKIKSLTEKFKKKVSGGNPRSIKQAIEAKQTRLDILHDRKANENKENMV